MRALPVVGIVGHGYVVPKFFGDLPVAGTPHTYVDRVAAAGGRPVILPGAAAVDLLDVVDCLVLTGTELDGNSGQALLDWVVSEAAFSEPSGKHLIESGDLS